MSYPKTVGIPPIPEKFLFVSDICEPHLCIASTLTLHLSLLSALLVVVASVCGAFLSSHCYVVDWW